MNFKSLPAFMVFIFSLCAGHTLGQFQVRNFSVSEGLPSSETYCIFQDQQGFIWIGTDQGVARFDGYEMTVFRATDGLEDPVVFGITQDHKGRIWFRTYSGRLFYYEHGKLHPYRFNNVLAKACSGHIMLSLYVGKDDQLWFQLSGNRGGMINSQGVYQMDDISDKSVTVIFKTIDQAHLIGVLGDSPTRQINFVIEGKKFATNEVLKMVRSRVISYVFWKGSLYFSVDRLIFKYDGIQLKKILSLRDVVISMYVDTTDRLWIGYHGGAGAERYSDPTFQNPWKPDFISGNSVSNITADTEGGIWITTLERGVFYVPNSVIEHYPFLTPVKVIHATGSDTEVLYNTSNRLMIAMDVKMKLVIAEENAGAEKWVIDKSGNIVMPPERPFRNPYFAKRAKYVQSRVIDHAEDRSGKLWILSNQGLRTHDRNGLITDAKVHFSRARCMLFEDSIIYLGERLGLQVLDSEMRLMDSPKSLANFRISKIVRLNSSYLLVATVGNGYLVVNDKDWSYKKYDIKGGFKASNIYAAQIRDSSIWMGTERGVFITTIKSVLKADPTYKQLSKSSGLIADQVNFLAFTRETVWAFSDEGISMIPYNLAQRNDKLGQLYFKQLIVNNKPRSILEYITLPHDSTNISLTYSFLSLKHQDFVCRYRLTKNDPWVYPKVRNIQLSSLAPNKYQLELEYSLDNFHWNSTEASFQFTVLQPWWRLWYVQLIILTIIAGLIFLYFKNYFRMQHEYRLKVVQTEIETLERERSRIAKELHDGVASNLGAIKMMTNFSLKKHDPSAAQELDEYFVTTINEIKGVIYGLTPPELERDGLTVCLKNYVGKLNKSFPVKIHLVINGEKTKQPAFDLSCFRIVQELVSNASKHSNSKNIFVQIDIRPDLLYILFKDDGIGFESNNTNNGLGLSHLESRVKSLKGELKMETGDKGTSYYITIPLALSSDSEPNSTL